MNCCQRVTLARAASFVLLVIAGCGGGDAPPPVAKATGIVTYQGKPVAGATVTFNKEGAQRVGTGLTNAEGKFEISTFANNDGAIVGDHVVTVVKQSGQQNTQRTTAPRTEEERMKAMQEFMAKTQAPADGRKPETSEIPEKYGNVSSSPLKPIVSSDPTKNDFKFELVD